MNPCTIAGGCLALLVALLPATASAQGGRLQLTSLDALSAKARETVDVAVDAAMLKATAGFLAGKDSDGAKLQELLAGVRGIYVKSFEFDAPGAYAESDIDAIRRQVSGSGWARVVGVRGKGELTEIYLWKNRETNGGLVVIAAEPKELTVVNIVGTVDLASLGALGPLIPKLSQSVGKTAR